MRPMDSSWLHPRDELVATMARIYRYRMTTTSGGNLSILDPDGSIWITGTNHGVYRWNGSNWDMIDGSATLIAVDPQGRPWVATDDGGIYQRVQ